MKRKNTQVVSLLCGSPEICKTCNKEDVKYRIHTQLYDADVCEFCMGKIVTVGVCIVKVKMKADAE